MDGHSGSKRISTPVSSESTYLSPSGLDLDPDPADLPKQHRAGKKDSSKLEQFVERIRAAVRYAIESVRHVFSRHDDADPVINISSPRKGQRTDKNMPKELVKANEEARAAYYASIFRDGVGENGRPRVPDPAPTAPSTPSTPTTSSAASIPSNPTAPSVSMVEISPGMASPGEKTFGQFLTLYQENQDLSFSPGYFAFTPDCLKHAEKVASGAVGQQLDKQVNAFEIKGALALLEGERKIRQDQERQAVRAAREQEKMTLLEAQKQQAPGQAEFEEFLSTYQKHVSANTPLIVYEGSKYLSEDCMAYAANFRTESASEQGMAAHYLSMWRANPVAALAQAKGAQAFVLPPPPASRPRRPVGAEPVMRWEAAVLTVKDIDDSERDKLARILNFRWDDLNQACKGLASIGSMGKQSVQTVSPEKTLLVGSAMVPDATPNVIDDLQQAKRLLAIASQPGIATQLSALHPRWKTMLDAAAQITTAIDEQLQVLLPARNPVKTAAVGLVDMADLSDVELSAGVRHFENFLTAFTKATQQGRAFQFVDNSAYLTPGCLAIANNALLTLNSRGDTDLVKADLDRFLAASFLINAATKKAGRQS